MDSNSPKERCSRKLRNRWRSNWREVFEHCAREESLGSKITNALKPEDDDYFILKPKHSAFFASNLELLLDELKVSKLILTGIAGNICVLFTANDAHMRGYDIHVPKDCIASNRKADTTYTLRQLSEVFKIKTGSLL
jgi:nicotinamidase-related amidase